VEVEIYRLRDPLPNYMKPRINARGIVVKYDNEIIGAYIDAGRQILWPALSIERD